MDWIYNFTVALYVNSSFFLHVFISVEIEFSTRTQAQKTDFWIESSHHIMKSSCYHKFTTRSGVTACIKMGGGPISPPLPLDPPLLW